MTINYIDEISMKNNPKRSKQSNIKNYCCFISFQLPVDDDRILMNEFSILIYKNCLIMTRELTESYITIINNIMIKNINFDFFMNIIYFQLYLVLFYIEQFR